MSKPLRRYHDRHNVKCNNNTVLSYNDFLLNTYRIFWWSKFIDVANNSGKWYWLTCVIVSITYKMLIFCHFQIKLRFLQMNCDQNSKDIRIFKSISQTHKRPWFNIIIIWSIFSAHTSYYLYAILILNNWPWYSILL